MSGAKKDRSGWYLIGLFAFLFVVRTLGGVGPTGPCKVDPESDACADYADYMEQQRYP